jgi:hypothetical protein
MNISLRACAAVASVAAIAGAFTACGGGSSKSATTSSATTSASSTSSPSGTSQQQYVAAVTAFAGCMRSHGIPVPDPNSQGQVEGAEALKQRYENTPQGQQALNACRSYLRGVVAERTAAQRQEVREAELKFAPCMRAHGIALADPTPGGDLQPPPQSVLSSPQFQHAKEACAYLLQRFEHSKAGG